MIFKDVFGEELKKVLCKDCLINITGIVHHREGFCLSCAIKRGLIK